MERFHPPGTTYRDRKKLREAGLLPPAGRGRPRKGTQMVPLGAVPVPPPPVDDDADVVVFRPQPGPQTAFLSTPADIAVYGGAAGGGKTVGLLMEAMRNVENPHFGAVLFRRTQIDVKKENSILDTSVPLYSAYGATLKIGSLKWTFPSGARVVFGGLEDDKAVEKWMGSSIAMIGFDELTQFTSRQFWRLFSRSRSTSGVRPYIRATCNPDADSWVADLLAWWIDQDTGLAIPERSGVLRWMVRARNEVVWADRPADLIAAYPNQRPKSFTFIPAYLSDNRILVEKDPDYMANLMALDVVERARMLDGNWKVRPAAGLYFNRTWVKMVDAIPAGTTFCRGWDLASTEKTQGNDPDWTCGTKIGLMPDGRYVVAHHTRMRKGPFDVETAIRNIADQDGRGVRISIPRDPGQGSVFQVASFGRMLAGWDVRFRPVSRSDGDKLNRFKGFSAQAQAGNVVVLRAPWNDSWFSELESFPESRHDDDVDSTSQAFNELTLSPKVSFSAPIVVTRQIAYPGTRGT